MRNADTIVARASAAGIGAIAIIRVSGPDAFLFTDTLLDSGSVKTSPRRTSDLNSHTSHLCTLYDADGAMDEALITLFKDGKSYTGENTVEISLHGSEYIVGRVLKAFICIGARLADPGEFTQRAFLHGKLDLAQAEAVADIIASEHKMAHNLAFKQLKGGFSRDISQLRDRLLHFTSLIELELDFAEEDVEFASRKDLRMLVEKIKAEMDALCCSFALGNAIKKGFALVLAGRPNAGKSTLFNTMLNEDRAIVSDIAGTTRDAIETQLFMDGMVLRLIDTAGIREANDIIEKEGIARTFAHVEKSGATLYTIDMVHCSFEDARADLHSLLSRTSRVWMVCNKKDLANESICSQWLELALGLGLPEPWFLSAIDSQEVEALKNHLQHRFLQGMEGLADQTIVTNLRHAKSLEDCGIEMQAVLNGLDSELTGDLMAFHLRRGIGFLSGITGEIGVDEILASIFSKFCIGK
ncbi:MAG: tRNA uridine-5-carboxymethylaminomethyl(34) synthesis GTPase MnmE [Bacteroidetes bacterium]|nr:tRNA uridine-5-carboxymethylaminomethyl(34) synthesis GTPase MnmE [Bacteroidota bacterium]